MPPPKRPSPSSPMTQVQHSPAGWTPPPAALHLAARPDRLSPSGPTPSRSRRSASSWTRPRRRTPSPWSSPARATRPRPRSTPTGPAPVTDETTARFWLSSDEIGSTFECRLEEAAWAPCDSAQPELTGWAPGSTRSGRRHGPRGEHRRHTCVPHLDGGDADPGPASTARRRTARTRRRRSPSAPTQRARPSRVPVWTATPGRPAPRRSSGQGSVSVSTPSRSGPPGPRASPTPVRPRTRGRSRSRWSQTTSSAADDAHRGPGRRLDDDGHHRDPRLHR